MERRATPARVVTGVALVVVAAALALWLFAPTAAVVDAQPREAAAEARAEPPAAPITAAPTRSETPVHREPVAGPDAPWRPMKDDAPPIDEATLALRVVVAATGTPCDRLWVTTDLDRSRSTAGLSLKVFGLVANAASWTDGEGSAELKVPAHVALVVTVTSPLRGVADVEQKFEPLETDERRAWTIPIALPAKAHRILRCVAAATGAPVAGATLKLGQKVVGASDDDGRFEFVIDHEHDDPIVALASGFATGVVAWEELKAATDERPCQLALEPGATLEVTLVDAAGGPVRLARIYVAPDEQRFDGRLGARSRGLEDRRWPWSPVDASGHVRFENLAVGRPLDVFIDRGPFGSFGPDGPSRWPQPRVVLTAGETRQLEVRLKAWAAVHGRVVGATTPPVRVAAASFGAKLSLSLDSLSSAEQKSRTVRWFGNVLVQCDDDGTFAIDQLVPGRIELTAVGADGATLAGTTLELNEGELRTGVELVVDRQKVVCQVTRAGKPVAKAAVQCDDANPIERARPLFTDDGGRCELLVANAPFTVTARMRGEETSRHFDAPPADAIELELGVRPRADVPSLVGRVVADTARGAAPPVVTAIRHDAVECTRDAVVVVAANPKFSLNGLAAGTWDLVVTAGGRVASLAGIAVQSGATTDLGDVALTSGATLDVTLAVDGTSAPPTADADASLLVRRGEVRLALVKLAPGELARLVLPAGKATLELRRDGQWLDAREVVVTADKSAAVVFGAK